MEYDTTQGVTSGSETYIGWVDYNFGCSALCPVTLTHHAVDAELVSGELRDHGPLLDVPDADGGQVAALARHQVAPVVREAQARDRLARGVGDVRLPVLPRVVQHHGASEIAIGFVNLYPGMMESSRIIVTVMISIFLQFSAIASIFYPMFYQRHL